MAEVGTLQLEFRDLSRASGDPSFRKACDAASDKILQLSNGMVLNSLRVATGDFQGALYSVGAGTDSYYEYLLKQWLQSGKTESK